MNEIDGTGMTHADVLKEVELYYESKVREHGPTPRGVDWNSHESQTMRFRQLLTVCDFSRPATIVDYGCGYGSMIEHLASLGVEFRYIGYDIAEEMLAHARSIHGDDPRCSFTSDLGSIEPADFAVASGVMNVRMQVPIDEWHRYVLTTIEELDRLSTRGFSFNALTKYSDADRMREDLYYADPLELFDLCKRRYSKYVALLHDYPLYEFTLLVRKNSES